MRSLKILAAVAGVPSRELARQTGVTRFHMSGVLGGGRRPSDELVLRTIAVLEEKLRDRAD